MSVTAETGLGSVAALWRYPVKSMLGEELNASAVSRHGLRGDRAYAIVDPETGKVASAKNPKKWPRLFDCRSAFVEPPAADGDLPAVRLTLPDGSLVDSDDAGVDAAISSVLGRSGTLATAVPDTPVLEEYWPDIEGLALREAVTDEALPEGTFFDCATVHLLTTATLDQLRALSPSGQFEVRRFRPNVVVRSPTEQRGFVESDWVERTLALGDEVLLKVTAECGRCVMTTLPQAELPGDPGILRAAAQHNGAHVGVYCEVIRGGTIRRGDGVTFA